MPNLATKKNNTPINSKIQECLTIYKLKTPALCFLGFKRTTGNYEFCKVFLKEESLQIMLISSLLKGLPKYNVYIECSMTRKEVINDVEQ